MSLPAVVFVDTSVIVRLIGIDGEELANEVAAEFETRREAGQRFCASGDGARRGWQSCRTAVLRTPAVRERLQQVIEEASQPNPPWILHQATLDQQFAQDLLAGDSTGSDLTTLLADGRLGTGDVAILVERDQFKQKMAHASMKSDA